MLINIHMGPPKGEGQMKERFDTLISPSGTVATLLKVEEDLGVENIIGIDESFPGEFESKKKIENLVDCDIAAGETPTLLFTLLIYNAERTIKYIDELKQRYGERVRIVVGGQLVPLAERAYLENANIDIVCVDDAEQIMPRLVYDTGENRTAHRYEGWVKDENNKHFSGMSYEKYWQIPERMAAQKREIGFTQLTIQGPGGPGCAWAARKGGAACSFCALQNITFMSRNTLREALQNEAEIARAFKPDRFFDVANQFLPTLIREEKKRWLEEYGRLREELGITHGKYAYLTVGSIDSGMAKLLKQIGINEVYLGIDHFDKMALLEERKPFKERGVLERTLDALSGENIKFRAGLVLGAAHETDKSLNAVRNGVRWLLDNYSDHLCAIGVFPVEIIPGSAVFAEMKQSGMRRDIFDKFERLGCLSRDEQRILTRTFVEERSKISYERIEAVERDIAEMVEHAGKFEYTVDDLRESRTRTPERIPHAA